MFYSTLLCALLFIQTTSVTSECPEDYEEIGGKCLLLEISDEPISWDNAKDVCCECGGTLATIDNITLFQELKATGCMNDSLWVGGYRRGAGFAWVLDSEGFGEWAQSNTKHTECTHSNCAKVELSGLVAEKCNEKLKGYICEAVSEEVTTTEDCPAGWEYLEPTYSCYKAFNQSISFTGNAECSTLSLAQLTCVKEGGNLVSVKSDEEKDMIQCLVGNVPAWIGLSETSYCGLAWADGMDSSNASHYLQTDQDSEKILPVCGLLLTVNNVTSIVMDECDVYYDQFVCSKPACTDVVASCSCFGCPEGWFEDSETQNCYSILCEEPVNYEESKIKCAAEGAFITSILDENDYDFVKGLLTKFEEEKAFIGMILGTAENSETMWEDGTKIDFNKLEGNVTGKCVVIDQSGQYLPVDCTEPQSVVCRKARGPIESEENPNG